MCGFLPFFFLHPLIQFPVECQHTAGIVLKQSKHAVITEVHKTELQTEPNNREHFSPPVLSLRMLLFRNALVLKATKYPPLYSRNKLLVLEISCFPSFTTGFWKKMNLRNFSYSYQYKTARNTKLNSAHTLPGGSRYCSEISLYPRRPIRHLDKSVGREFGRGCSSKSQEKTNGKGETTANAAADLRHSKAFSCHFSPTQTRAANFFLHLVPKTISVLKCKGLWAHPITSQVFPPVPKQFSGLYKTRWGR